MGRKKNEEIGPEQRQALDHKQSHPEALSILLLKPRIPQNTGSIARMCAATGSRLDLVDPLFKIDDSKLKRAGLDYWHLLDVRTYASFEEWREQNASKTLWLVEVGAPKLYTEVSFSRGDVLVFGDEQEGIDPAILAHWKHQHIGIPQINVRSLNLATSAGIVTFEALRQLGWYTQNG